MMTPLVKESENMLARLSRAEKASVLRWLITELDATFPRIECRPGVCGGEPCVVRTRIPVWVLVHARQNGLSDEDLLRSFPSLTIEDLTDAWAYTLENPGEIERQIARHEAS